MSSAVTERPVWMAGTRAMLVGGEWVPARSGETMRDVDPADEELLADVPAGGLADVDAAVMAARDAAPAWAALSPDRRGRVLWRLAELIEEHADELALIDTLDNGKPLVTARRVDLPAAAQMLRYWAGWPTKIEGATVATSLPGRLHAYTKREPLGVVGVILPWNAPALFVAWKVGGALACGNAVVLKPAEETPLSALRIAELAQRAGVPAGVLNVVTGSGETAGAALAAHRDVDKVAFTGSVATGRLVVAAALGNLKKVSLELGGKSPNIVFADANLEEAIAGAAQAAFFNAGCVCAAGSRLYVEAPVYEEVIEGVCAAAQRLRLGPGVDAATRMGPLVSQAQLERVEGLVDAAVADGACALTGARRAERPGFFYEPTVLADVDAGMAVAREEVFGPVVVAAPFHGLDEVIARANDTSYGLAAGVWTRDLARAHTLADELRAGTVWVNTYNLVDPALPFGGMRLSGWGRDLGREAIELYTETKAVCVRLG